MLSLRLYYADLYEAEEMTIKYLEAAKEATNADESIIKINNFFKTHNMWFEKYKKLDNMKWYEKLFYKRES